MILRSPKWEKTFFIAIVAHYFFILHTCVFSCELLHNKQNYRLLIQCLYRGEPLYAYADFTMKQMAMQNCFFNYMYDKIYYFTVKQDKLCLELLFENYESALFRFG